MQGVIYARYSTDGQRDASIDDQVRNCSRFAERESIVIEHVYQDRAVSGAVRARAGYQQMLEAAMAGEFSVLLVEDLSRLSRDDYEMKGVLRRLTWQGVRVIGVADGYDSQRKGHKIHAGFKGLMNEMFLDDVRDRTHRGMTGQAIKGYNCGGRTYGYRNVPIEDQSRHDAYGRPAVIGVEYAIDEEQANVVRRIHGWYASGHSYKWIAHELNGEKVPSSRGGTWAASAVKVILENEMYGGMLIWNRRVWVKHPDTGRRTSRPRPKKEWIVSERSALRIVSQDVLDAVRQRQRTSRASGLGKHGSAARKYLFSGMLRCSDCGGNFVIAAGGGRYGCANHKTRGSAVCANAATVSRRILERCILASVKERLRDPRCVERFKSSAIRLIESHNASDRADQLQRELALAQRTRDNLLSAIKQGILTAGTKEALESAEAEVAVLIAELQRVERSKVSAILPKALERFARAINELESRLCGHVDPARAILKSILGDQILIHRRGEYLEVELADCAQVLIANALNSRFDSGGCGGPQRLESTFVPLRHSECGFPGEVRHRKRAVRQAKLNPPAKCS